MMNNIFYITFIGFFVGVIGTGVGGILAIGLGKPSNRLLSFILGFSAGIMLAIVCFDLLPEAFQRGNLYISSIGIAMGVIMIIIFDEIIHKHKGNKYHHKKSFVKMGALIGLGVALHNFPEGLAIGSGFMATKELGMGIAIVIALHNIPEGISMAAPMRVGGMSKFKAVLYTWLVGLPMGIGALIGSVLGEISEVFIAFCLAFSGGTMLYITCGELIPNSKKIHIGRTSTIGLIFGFLIGLLITK
ncbi:ZIP family metal transporter [Paramaledivibacter caminithermalis]|jgi:ZIP family zinc transporter|uniref:Zinc transporter, ZIP family n=1 Tax=Paramaledivibacter caminithermalis (strain DSM 15212 / CIP 107654 / DViRD3) TaxID=1121301 RepID=A0A1M6L283_PARC5|nr:ZIP family metal transporter [Paramaledivibacter caminithermalis]SHJ65328.1 zinc transporter, ZIP family [Paramaledivibacter caminithermalis DSM 15212]